MSAVTAIDMAGSNVAKSRNSFRLMSTPYSVNSFINDVYRQFFEFVGETNREKVNNRRLYYSFQYPILDPQGSRDQFYYNIGKHYGASDHAVYLNAGIPAILLNNWPELAYHTSEDSASNADPTQFKRAAFIGLAASLVMANADGPGALRVVEMVAGYAAERSGRELGLALQSLGDGATLREARARVRINNEREAATIRSATVLADNDAAARKQIETFASAFQEANLASALASVEAYAAARGITAPAPSAIEIQAASPIPIRKKTDAPGFGGGGRTLGPGEADKLTGMGLGEARAFANGKRSILDIRDAVSTEFGAIDVKLFLAAFEELSKSGDCELVKK